MKRNLKEKHNEVNEEDILHGYGLLIEAIILSALEKATVPNGWGKTRVVSARMLERKASDIKEIESWVKTDNADVWFGFYEIFMGSNREKSKKNFIKLLRKHKRRFNKLSTGQLLTSK